MIALLHAAVVGMLFGTGTYMLLQRSAIRLILGLSLLTHGVNLLLFGTSGLRNGQPPIIADKKTFAGEISAFVDPLPQALILTAIVISFGVTAFLVVLVNQRNTVVHSEEECLPGDPFALNDPTPDMIKAAAEDYEYLEYRLADERRQRKVETGQAA